MSWNIRNVSYPINLRGLLQQTDEALIYKIPSFTMATAAAVDVRSTASGMMGLAMRRFELHNRSGVANSVGIGFRYHNAAWLAGQWTDATNTYTDDTADAQDLPGTTADFPLTTTTINDGFVILSPVPFDWVSIRVITDEVIGVGVLHAVRYSNFAGTGWTALDTNTPFVDSLSGTIAYTGELRFVWPAPNNWGKVVYLGNIPAGYYALNVRATDAPDTTGGVASAMEIGSMIAVKNLADNGVYENELSTFNSPYADAVMAFFGGTANAGNRVYAEITTG